MIELCFRLRRGVFVLDIDAHLPNAVTGVFGPSGAGKSTLLHVLAGLTTPDEGRVHVDGRVLLDTARGICLPAHERRVGMVFQDARLFPHLTVEGNLRFGLRAGRGTRSVEFDDIVSLLELGPLLHRRVRSLSGGEGQRVAIGRALLSSPSILLLDEPLAALDQNRKEQILPFLQRIRDNVRVPIMYVSHDLREILQLTDQLLILHEGRLAGHGRYADLVLRPEAWPVAPELINVLLGRVMQHDPSSGFTLIELRATADSPNGDAVLRAPFSPHLRLGMELSVALRPEDVALALAPVTGISIQNQLPGRILRVSRAAGQAMLEIDIGCPLVARVTARTMEAMSLKEGLDVFCLIKSNAIRLLGGHDSQTTRPPT